MSKAPTRTEDQIRAQLATDLQVANDAAELAARQAHNIAAAKVAPAATVFQRKNDELVHGRDVLVRKLRNDEQQELARVQKEVRARFRAAVHAAEEVCDAGREAARAERDAVIKPIEIELQGLLKQLTDAHTATVADIKAEAAKELQALKAAAQPVVESEPVTPETVAG